MLSYMKRGPFFYTRIIRLAAPVILQNILTNMLVVVDSFIVGSLGEQALAAVTLAGIPQQVITMFSFGVQSGTSILVSQYRGKNDWDSINRVMGVGMWVTTTVTVLYAAVQLLFPLQFMSFLEMMRKSLRWHLSTTVQWHYQTFSIRLIWCI